MTALWAEGCGIALSGDEHEVSVTGFTFSAIWHDRHSADWLAALATPYPAAPDFSKGKRVTRFSGRFAPLRIVFPCHPYAGGRMGSMLSCRDMALWLSTHSAPAYGAERWWRQPPKGGLNFIWSLAYRTFDALGGLTALTGTEGLLRPDLGYKNSLMM